MTGFLVRSPLQHFPRASPREMKDRFPAETFADVDGLPVTTSFAIFKPDLITVVGQPIKYWKLNGDLVELMSAAEIQAVNDAEAIAKKDLSADGFDSAHPNVNRAVLEIIIDEFNRHSNRTNALLDAIDNAVNLGSLQTAVQGINNIPIRTLADLKAALRNKLDG